MTYKQTSLLTRAAAALLLAVGLTACFTENDWHIAPPPGQGGQVVGKAAIWVTSGNKSKLHQSMTDLSIIEQKEDAKPQLLIDATDKKQEIDGYGAALTGSSAYLIKRMDATSRKQLLERLFHPEKGIGLSYLRLTIGASDFSLSSYTYNDLPAGETDPNMERFSLGKDLEDVVPVLKEILAINPSIKLMGSPWSAPAWMKTNGHLNGGSLKAEHQAAYARYLLKYVQTMAQQGIRIDAITIQNEPLHTTPGYPTMKMEAAEQAAFVRTHLGPAFQAAGVDTKIVAYDHNFDRVDYPMNVLNDAAAKQFVAGSAFHAYGGDVRALAGLQQAHPDKGIYFTEISGGEWETDFDKNLQWYMSNILIGTANQWSRNALFWNLALDTQHGPQNGGCTDCRGVVTLNGTEVTPNIEYYTLAHMAQHVRPGARRLASTLQGVNEVEHVAFENKDGSKALVLLNKGNSTAVFAVGAQGKQFTVSLEGRATATIQWK